MSVSTHGAESERPYDRACRVTVPEEKADLVGALLIDRLGAYEELESREGMRTLVFYPDRDGAPRVDRRTVRSLLRDAGLGERLVLEWRRVRRDWVLGWRDHFRPLIVGKVYVRPPWEEPASPDLLDVVINPGLAFGTGLHPTTRGVLTLLQSAGGAQGAATGAPTCCLPLVDVGTGSGILAIAAAKLGYAPVRAFDNDPLAVTAALDNVAENGVQVEVWQGDLEEIQCDIFAGAVVLANLTAGPVSALLRRLALPDLEGREGQSGGPGRVIVSGILVDEQEAGVSAVARACGYRVVQRWPEGEWVALDLRPLQS